MPARPRVICHMMTTLDGRIDAARWPDVGPARAEYEQTSDALDAPAWMCGRVTMQEFADGVRSREEAGADARPADAAERPDHTAPGEHTSYAIALDPSGRLLWESGEIDGDHVVAVLSTRVSDPYLDGLRTAGVSYVLVGPGEGGDLDLVAALEKLTDRFGIETLLLEGGGGINGSFLRAGLVDEVSLLLAPLADGAVGTPTLFDAGEAPEGKARRLTLQSIEQRDGGVLWLRYQVEA
jgi:2,5-diamino-6-(ribosylamino)-4(3H)-pyrimidinone 5'-phosphate reductase